MDRPFHGSDDVPEVTAYRVRDALSMGVLELVPVRERHRQVAQRGHHGDHFDGHVLRRGVRGCELESVYGFAASVGRDHHWTLHNKPPVRTGRAPPGTYMILHGAGGYCRELEEMPVGDDTVSEIAHHGVPRSLAVGRPAAHLAGRPETVNPRTARAHP